MAEENEEKEVESTEEKKVEPTEDSEARSQIFDQLDSAVDKTYQFAVSHKVDTAAYVVLILGIIVSFFNPTFGGAMVGVIFGLYYGDEILRGLEGVQSYIDQQGTFKPLILAGALVCLLFALPFFFVALAIVVGGKAIVERGGS